MYCIIKYGTMPSSSFEDEAVKVPFLRCDLKPLLNIFIDKFTVNKTGGQ